ncbi:hypothetical protein TNCV_4103631 [Trichonephila clavipes]|nr:hypothetical protein TNCV_4103631 [Trichonephila clavipes]
MRERRMPKGSSFYKRLHLFADRLVNISSLSKTPSYLFSVFKGHRSVTAKPQDRVHPLKTLSDVSKRKKRDLKVGLKNSCGLLSTKSRVSSKSILHFKEIRNYRRHSSLLYVILCKTSKIQAET